MALPVHSWGCLLKPHDSILQGFGMTGGAVKLGGFGGVIGKILGGDGVEKCMKNVDKLSDRKAFSIQFFQSVLKVSKLLIIMP